MRRSFALLLGAVLLGLTGSCGPHALGLTISLAADCAFAVPAGGSLLYEVVVDGVDGGQTPRVCGACLAVATPIGDGAGVLALLRGSAPSCALSPGSTLHVRLTSFAGAGCDQATAGPPAGRLCGLGPAVVAGDGHGDQESSAQVSCAAGCADATCKPISCQDQGKDCDSVGDGCGTTLDCGSCHPPLKCGGGGTPNVCAK